MALIVNLDSGAMVTGLDKRRNEEGVKTGEGKDEGEMDKLEKWKQNRAVKGLIHEMGCQS